MRAQYGSRTERYPLAGCQPLALVRLFRRSRPGRHSRRSIQSLRPVCRSFTQPGSSTDAAHGEIFVRFFRAGSGPVRAHPTPPDAAFATSDVCEPHLCALVVDDPGRPRSALPERRSRLQRTTDILDAFSPIPLGGFTNGVRHRSCKQCPSGSEGGTSSKCGGAVVGRLADWIDAKPYRLKLILFAHTAAVGAILFAATWL